MSLTNYPLVLCGVTLVLLWTSAKLGARFAHRAGPIREDLGVVMTATLTLLGLIVGFTFSMAVARYDQRKQYEEEEANAIGTEYVRADLLPTGRDDVRRLLRDYLEQRILYYEARHPEALTRINAETAQLQAQMWDAVKSGIASEQTPITWLVVAGMNTVINSQGYTQAAWWNRIPTAAWLLLEFIAVCATAMVGLSWHGGRSTGLLMGVLPGIVSAALLLIADIDSPRSGLIHVKPVNLISLASSLGP
jgi:hypothetical protein